MEINSQLRRRRGSWVDRSIFPSCCCARIPRLPSRRLIALCAEKHLHDWQPSGIDMADIGSCRQRREQAAGEESPLDQFACLASPARPSKTSHGWRRRCTPKSRWELFTGRRATDGPSLCHSASHALHFIDSDNYEDRLRRDIDACAKCTSSSTSRPWFCLPLAP